MNKFAKALLLSLVFAAPLGISATAVQAKPTTAQTQAAKVSQAQPEAKAMRKRRRVRRRRAAVNPVTNQQAQVKAVKKKKVRRPTTGTTTAPSPTKKAVSAK